MGFLSRFFVSHSGEEAEEEKGEEEEEEKEEKEEQEEEEGWHKTQLYHIILAHLDSCLLSTNFAIYTSDKHEKILVFSICPESQLMSSVAALSGVCALKATESRHKQSNITQTYKTEPEHTNQSKHTLPKTEVPQFSL